MEKPVRKVTRKRKVDDTNEENLDKPVKKSRGIVKSGTSKKKESNPRQKTKAKDAEETKARNESEREPSNSEILHSKSIQNDNKYEIWNEAEMLSHVERIPPKLAHNFIGLLSEGCTLPFIARYRTFVVDNLKPDR